MENAACASNPSAGGSIAGVRRWLRTIGPTLIVASVVLGPGSSILISNKVGCQYGYSMLWLLVAAAVLMVGMPALAARIGVATKKPLCGELADRIGRLFAALVGILLLLVITAFQSSNNMAVVTSIEAFFSPNASVEQGDVETSTTEGVWLWVSLNQKVRWTKFRRWCILGICLNASSKRQKDTQELSRSILDAAVPDAEPKEASEPEPEKNPAAVALGRLGRLKGGKARAEKLTAKQRSEIAMKAAAARWKDQDSSS